jgi:SPP1 gp7 family putative phage head morphogenesis protein
MFDRVVRHQVQLERHKAGLFARIAPSLESVFDQVIAETRADLSKIRRVQIRQGSFDSKRIRTLTSSLIRKQKELFKRGYRAAMRRAGKELKKLAITEAEWVRQAIRASMPISIDFATPAIGTLEALVTQKPAHGKLLAEWFSDLSDSARRRIGATTRAGIAQGHGVDKIVRAIEGKNGIPVDRRHLRSAVRTLATDISSRAKEEAYKKSNVVRAVRWVSTLDARTTDICAGLDGKEFHVEKGPRPPAHHQCRSTTTPVLKSWKALGIKAKELKPGVRAQMPGTRGKTFANENYGDFLTRQPRAFQNDVLGPQRAELFRSGKVKIDEFVDYSKFPPRSFTISELRRRSGLPALAKAGV